MVETLLSISLFAGMGAFTVCSVLLNEGRHAERRRERARTPRVPGTRTVRLP